MITKDQIKSLPQVIGIYLFKKGTEYVYIGKSLNIRERVHNHSERARIDAKEKAIIENSDTVEYVICSSELHALVLESQLIQKNHPPYNVIWKDDKSYLYIKIPVRDPFPRISMVRRENDGKSLYFGPYSSTKDVRFLLHSIRKVVPFCTQKQPIKKPCFYSKIGLCNPCPGSVDNGMSELQFKKVKKQYRAQIKKVITILQGKAETILEEFRIQIDRHSKDQEYETSLLLRDKLLQLEQLIHLRSFERFEYSNAYDPDRALQKLTSILYTVTKQTFKLHRIECYDISNLMQQEATASMVVATDGILDKAEYKRFKMKKTGVSDFKMLTETIERRMNNDWLRPDLIVLDGGTPQIMTIDGVLKRLNITIPLIGIAKHPDRIVVLIQGATKTYKFSLHNEGFKLIQQLRDESHRFAKKYHTLIRGKKFKME
jgi:excinuclease ABC subunit C